MAVYSFDGRKPTIGEGTYIHPTASIIGDVRLGKRCFVGPGASLRGDYGTIIVGNEVSLQDNMVIHIRQDTTALIEDRVTLGHGCIVHNATIRHSAVIGMGSIVSDYSEVGRWAVVAEGAVVKNHQIVPDEAIVAGVPARVIGKIDEDFKRLWNSSKDMYASLAEEGYPNRLKRID